MHTLQIKNVSKHYANHTALNKVSFDVKKGIIFGLLGPNGAGKTSLIRIINQITGPDEGEILLYGEKLNKNHIPTIGYLPEERGLYKKMNVVDQLTYLARLRGMSKKEASTIIKHWLEKFEATSWAKKKIEELSKGMQQKIQFIATVMHEPKFIILDEPFTGFDPKNTELIKDEIMRLKNNGATIMLSTHRMENVEAICDEMVIINKSEVAATGTIDAIRNSQKKDIFEITYQGNLALDSLSQISVISDKATENGHRVQFKFIGENQGLDMFSGKGIKVTEYKEVIPSMQEVFINLTKEQ